jgi:NTP pyrophosphatase (non-canonical NTP hydrolase)
MLRTLEFRNAIAEAKAAAQRGDTNTALFDLLAVVSILAGNLESELDDIKRELSEKR